MSSRGATVFPGDVLLLDTRVQRLYKRDEYGRAAGFIDLPTGTRCMAISANGRNTDWVLVIAPWTLGWAWLGDVGNIEREAIEV